ncbi:hypothetical protein [Haloferax sp. YSMS24]|uniref:hypothetical protein n=1 Tax=Haloferax sp. YSMS24 TaxID=3388425 RepID=UPI00398D3543
MSTPTKSELAVGDPYSHTRRFTPEVRRRSAQVRTSVLVVFASLVALGVILVVLTLLSLAPGGPVTGAAGLLVLVAAIGGTPTLVRGIVRIGTTR